MKILILLASVAMTWGLVATFGWISIAACFLLALGSLVFSSGTAADDEAKGPARHREERYFDASSAPQGGL
jgi:hypothetical protein